MYAAKARAPVPDGRGFGATILPCKAGSGSNSPAAPLATPRWETQSPQRSGPTREREFRAWSPGARPESLGLRALRAEPLEARRARRASPARLAPPWALEQSFRIGERLDGTALSAARLALLDGSIFSVNQAILSLNSGAIHVHQDMCVAYSASSHAYYLLFKRNCQDLALSVLERLQGPRLRRSPLGGDRLAERLLLAAVRGQMLRSSVPALLPPKRLGPPTSLSVADDSETCQAATSSVSTPPAAAIVASSEPVAAVPCGAPEPRLPPLMTGMSVQIGPYSCRITVPIGTGSFGAVWAADISGSSGNSGGVVAVKEIPCHSSAELECADYEGLLLQQLMAQSSGAEHPLQRVPAFVASEAECLGTQFWRVRLAMSKLPGVPLDQFMAEHTASSSARVQFVAACSFARDLILQLAPTFQYIAKLAYHRDVNAHNILVDVAGSEPSFGLVDFGLACGSELWHGPVGATSWHLVDIGGDCRYWPMGAWLQFECGWQELSKYPPLALEYQGQLDLHALGITALQALSALSPRSPDASKLPREVWELLSTWQDYWEAVSLCWQRLLDTFRNGGDAYALKVRCIQEGVHNMVGQKLAALREVLRNVGEAFSMESSECEVDAPQIGVVPSLCAALLELVSAGGVTGLNESVQTSQWQTVRFVALNGTLPDPCGEASTLCDMHGNSFPEPSAETDWIPMTRPDLSAALASLDLQSSRDTAP